MRSKNGSSPLGTMVVLKPRGVAPRPRPAAPPPQDDRKPARDVLAMHVLRAIFAAQTKHRHITLEDVARAVGARKAEVRSVVSDLDRQGFVDAMRMRLTFAGFAIAASTGEALRALRQAPSAVHKAA